jgi:hypothetical protein
MCQPLSLWLFSSPAAVLSFLFPGDIIPLLTAAQLAEQAMADAHSGGGGGGSSHGSSSGSTRSAPTAEERARVSAAV